VFSSALQARIQVQRLNYLKVFRIDYRTIQGYIEVPVKGADERAKRRFVLSGQTRLAVVPNDIDDSCLHCLYLGNER